jgi:hypothetical protein
MMDRVTGLKSLICGVLLNLFQHPINKFGGFRNKFGMTLLLSVIVSSTLFSQVTVTTEANKASVQIGEPIEVKAEVSYNTSFSSDSLRILDLNTWCKPFEILELKADTFTPNEEHPNSMRRVYTYTVSTFDTGLVKIPPFKIIAGQDTICSDSISIEIAVMEVDTSKGIVDIVNAKSIEYSFWEKVKDSPVTPIVLLAILLAVLVFFLYKYWKKTQANTITETPKEPEIIILPHEEALAALARVRKEKSWQHQEIKIFYSEVSVIFRTYLEKRYRYKALELATSEALNELRLFAPDSTFIQDTRQILTLSDMVKYAREGSNEEQILRILDLVENLVNRSEQQRAADAKIVSEAKNTNNEN